jgi:hypothetical protein
VIYTWDSIILRVHYSSTKEVANGTVILDIRDFKQQRLIVLDSGLKVPIRKGQHYVDCFIPSLPLSAGDYYLGAGLTISVTEWLWRETNIASFKVQGKDVFDLGRPPTISRMIFALQHEWRNLSG